MVKKIKREMEKSGLLQYNHAIGEVGLMGAEDSGRGIRTGYKNSVSIISASLTDIEIEILDKFVSLGLAPSRSELIRFCVLYSANYLHELLETRAKIIKKDKLDAVSKKQEILPDTIYIKNGGIKYQKYVKEVRY